jgi:serine/threonine protein kinase
MLYQPLIQYHTLSFLSGVPPLSKLQPMKALFKIPQSKPPTLASNQKWSKQFFEFLAAGLRKQPGKRLDSGEMLRTDWMKKVRHCRCHVISTLVTVNHGYHAGGRP